ncbi:MAG: peptide chain release factor N(5)-glutamine methyltransferase [Acidobacteria bacterium]|nr:peptide chain release factor N(5)-glutamine methyltransferase [Acidobacteriota bacterium]
MSDLAELIKTGAETLKAAGIPEPGREAASLLAFAICKDRTFLIAHPENVPDKAASDRYLKFIDRRAGREPFHYIVGTKEFFGLDFKVSPAVLIPRPETEMLVEQAVDFLAGRMGAVFCEVGVGSGCISISVLIHSPHANAVGLEISDSAIVIARENTSIHGVEDRLDVRKSDLFASLIEKERFDLIVSNPPYISIADFARLEPDVREFEPQTALTDQGDGLSVIRRMVKNAPGYLKEDGLLIIEIGYDQADEVVDLLNGGPWKDVAARADFQGIRRTVSAVFDKMKHW